MSVESMRIGELARRTGIPLANLRYYESEGLIESDRSRGCHLRFPKGTIERARQVEQLLTQNLTTSEIRTQIGRDSRPSQQPKPIHIGELCRQTGLPLPTIRYYVKQGLIHCTQSATKYRVFTDDAVDQVRRVLYLRSLNLTLTEVKTLMDWSELPQTFNPETHKIMATRLQRIVAQKTILEELEQRIGSWISGFSDTDSSAPQASGNAIPSEVERRVRGDRSTCGRPN